MIKAATLLTILAFALVPIYQSKPIYKPIEKDSILFGEWMIAGFGHVEDDGRVIWGLCNACPLIEFHKSGEGIIKYPGGPDDIIRWSIKTGKLSFKGINTHLHGLIHANVVYDYSLKDNNQTIILIDAKKHFELKLNKTTSN